MSSCPMLASRHVKSVRMDSPKRNFFDGDVHASTRLRTNLPRPSEVTDADLSDAEVSLQEPGATAEPSRRWPRHAV